MRVSRAKKAKIDFFILKEVRKIGVIELGVIFLMNACSSRPVIPDDAD